MNHKESDKVFPGFSKAFNLDAVKKYMKRALRKKQRSTHVESCEIADVKYEPGRQCIILYKAKLSNSYFHKNWEQLFLGKVMKRDEEVQAQPKQAFSSKSLKMTFSPFPYDLQMTWLPECCDNKAMKSKLAAIIPNKQYKIQDLQISLLAYTPQMRATFLYQIHLLDKVTGKEEHWEWIAKTNMFKPSPRVYANYLALWKSAQGKIHMPKPTGFLLSPQLTFQEKIKGIRLGAIVDDPHIDIILENTAHAIASFHKLQLPLSNIRKLDQEVKTLYRWSDVLIDLRPDLKKRMKSLRKNILSTMEKWFKVVGPIHADFHHTNLLVEGTKVQLIDMDELSLGDPCLDIGRFLSSLRIPSLRTFGSFDGLKEQRENFLETYLKHSNQDERRIRIFESASLFTSAASAFRLQRTNWESEVFMLLEESENAFKLAKNGVPASRSKKTQPLQLSKEMKILWAKDNAYIYTLLLPQIPVSDPRALISCEFHGSCTKKDFESLCYKLVSKINDHKIKEKIELFLHKRREGRTFYDYVAYVNKKMEGTDTCLFFPQPFGYLSELDCLAFYQFKGKSLYRILEAPKSNAVDCLIHTAKALAAFHKIEVENDPKIKVKPLISPSHRFPQGIGSHKVFARIQQHETLLEEKLHQIPDQNSYVLLYSILKLKWTIDQIRLPFPIKKMISHPFQDVGILNAKILSFGLQTNQIDKSKRLLDTFNKTYAELMGIDVEKLSIFETQALVKEANNILQKQKNSELASQLLDAAEKKFDG